MGVASSVDASRVDLVRSFASLSRDDLAYAGGKGANLGELRTGVMHGTLPFVRTTEELRHCRELVGQRKLIPRARGLGLRTSIFGQAPSVHPEYAELLVRAGIDAISVDADAAPRTRALVASAERRVLLDFARSHGTPDAPSSV
jgi:phosphoenolpyruvate synthase/pyruvate phosphate dikinase